MGIYLVIRSVVVGLSIGFTFYDFVGYIARVDGVSMQPVLNPNNAEKDYIFLNRWSAKNYSIKRGEIVSLFSPRNQDQVSKLSMTDSPFRNFLFCLYRF